MKGTLLENTLLAPYTTWQIGGAAKQIYQPAGIDDLAIFLSTLPGDEKLLWLGHGSNVLISDDGFDGTVILMRNTLNNITVKKNRIYAEAGVPLTQLVKFAAAHALSGINCLAGIPGTVGGALSMNAGAYGVQIWDHVIQVETINRQGKQFLRSKRYYDVQYRQVNGADNEWFMGAYFELSVGNQRAELDQVKNFLNKRQQKHPLDLPSAGSVFRNPDNDHAGRLIEACGLKGYQMGGAQVSEKHANFIVNVGGATAADVSRLVDYIASVVQTEFNIKLIPEIHKV